MLQSNQSTSKNIIISIYMFSDNVQKQWQWEQEMFWVYSRCSRMIHRKSWVLLVESVSLLSLMTTIPIMNKNPPLHHVEWEKRKKVTHSTRLASTVTPRYTRLIFLSKYKTDKHCHARLYSPCTGLNNSHPVLVSTPPCQITGQRTSAALESES